MGHLPLHRYELFHSSDPAYVCDMVGRILGPERLEVMGSTPLDVRMHSRRLFDVSISFLAYGPEVVVEANSTNGYFAIHLPLTGCSEVRHRRGLFTSTPALALVVSPSDAVAIRWFPGCAKLLIRIERVALETRRASMLGECLRHPLRFESEMDVERGGGASLARSIRYFAKQLGHAREIVNNDLFVHEFERMLMVELLMNQPHSYSDQLRLLRDR